MRRREKARATQDDKERGGKLDLWAGGVDDKLLMSCRVGSCWSLNGGGRILWPKRKVLKQYNRAGM